MRSRLNRLSIPFPKTVISKKVREISRIRSVMESALVQCSFPRIFPCGKGPQEIFKRITLGQRMGQDAEA